LQRCLLRDVIGNLTRVDHHVVGQENEQLHRWIVVHEADDILGDRLFRGEVCVVKVVHVVATERYGGRDVIGKILEGVWARFIILGKERAFFFRQGITCADLAQEFPRRTERDLHEIRTQSVAQPVAAVRHPELVEQLLRRNFRPLPLIKERLLRGRQFGPAKCDAGSVALQRFDQAPGRLALCRGFFR